MYANDLPMLLSVNHLFEGAVSLRSLGWDAIAWKYPQVLARTRDLSKLGCVILGSDIIKMDSDGRLSSTFDGSHYKPTASADDAVLSYAAFADYVLNYVKLCGEGFLFEVALDSTHFSELSADRALGRHRLIACRSDCD